MRYDPLIGQQPRRQPIPAVTTFLIAVAIGGCATSSGDSSPVDTPAATPESAATSTAPAPIDWVTKEFCPRYQEQIDCFEMAVPTTWHGYEHRGAFDPLLFRSDVNDEDIWDSSVMNGRFEVMLDGQQSNGAEISAAGGAQEDFVGGLPATRYDDRLNPSDDPWRDRWRVLARVNHTGHRYLFSLEACCAADLEAATPTLAIMDRMLASVKFKDAPLADAGWTSTIIPTDRHPTSGDAGLQPPAAWRLTWGVRHPHGWQVTPLAGGDDGWEVMSADDGLAAGPLVLRAEPMPTMDQARWAALPNWSPFNNGNEIRQLDDTTTDGQRTLTLVAWNDLPFMRYIATMPELPSGSPERRLYEGAIARIATESTTSWSHPTGYPGPGAP